MPSYRIHLPVGTMLPGHVPGEVLDTLVAVVGSHVVVEHQDVEIVRGVPRAVVRFLVPATSRADEDALARRIADDVVTGVGEVATCGVPVITRRDGGRFLPLVGPGCAR